MLATSGFTRGTVTACDQVRFLLAVSPAMLDNPGMSDQRRRYNDQRYVHFLTFSVYKRRRLLELDHPNRIVLGGRSHQPRSHVGQVPRLCGHARSCACSALVARPTRVATLCAWLEAHERFCHSSLVRRLRAALLRGLWPGSPILAAPGRMSSRFTASASCWRS